MRAGWEGNLELQRRVAAHPCQAREIVEAVITRAEHVRALAVDWPDADSLVGLEILPDGGLRLEAVPTTPIDQTTHAPGQYITKFVPPQRPVALVEWTGSEDAAFELDRLKARVIDQRDGGQAKEVVRWRLQLFALVEVDGTGFEAVHRFAEITSREADATGGASPYELEFAWDVGRPRPASFVPVVHGDENLVGGFDHPVTLVRLTPLTQGGVAGNCGWAVDDAVDEHVGPGGAILSLAAASDATGAGAAGGLVLDTSEPGVPWLVLEAGSYAEATIQFSVNPFDLGVVPTEEVEFSVRGQRPAGSSITAEVLKDGGNPLADADWVEIEDGQTTDDLAGVSARQTYALRATLAPDAAGDVTPTLRELGVREVIRRNLDGLATVEAARAAVDPVALTGETAQPIVRALRDGRADFRDAITELVTEHFPADIQFRHYVGFGEVGSYEHRPHWLHLDTYLIDDHEDGGVPIAFTCTSVLAKLDAAVLPVYDAVAKEQTPLAYGGQALDTVVADILDGQLGLAARYRGEGPTDTTPVTNTIEDSGAKVELNALGNIAGGAWIASQGRIRFVPLLADRGAVRAYFPLEATTAQRVTPGLAHRVPEFFADFGWSEDRQEFTGRTRHFDSDSIANLGLDGVESPRELEEAVARWVQDEATANRLCRRQTEHFAPGLIQIGYRSMWRHPALEIGDVVAVETDRFAARDPKTGRAVKGRVWARGVIVLHEGGMGTGFTVWVPRYFDIVSAEEGVARPGFVDPAIDQLRVTVDKAGIVTVSGHANAVSGSVRIVAQASVKPARVDAQGGSVTLTDQDGNFELVGAAQIDVAQIAFAAALAYETVSGTGVESTNLARAAGARDSLLPGLDPRLEPTADRSAVHVHVTPESHVDEALGLTLRSDESAAAAVWDLVQDNLSTELRFVPSGVEIDGSTAWFLERGGGAWAQKLKAIPLARDQVSNLHLRTVGQDTGLLSPWEAVVIPSREQPWLESVAAIWDEVARELRGSARGGAFCATATFQWSDDDFVTIAHEDLGVTLIDGQKQVRAFAPTGDFREKEWGFRVIPFNAGGLVGVPQDDAVYVPPVDTTNPPGQGTWLNDYVVSSEASSGETPLLDQANDPLEAVGEYTVRATNLDDPSAAPWAGILRVVSGALAVGAIFEQGIDPNDPRIFTVSGVPQVALRSSVTAQVVRVEIEHTLTKTTAGVLGGGPFGADAGDLMFAAGLDDWQRRAAGVEGTVLKSSGGVPTYEALGFRNEIINGTWIFSAPISAAGGVSAPGDLELFPADALDADIIFRTGPALERGRIRRNGTWVVGQNAQWFDPDGVAVIRSDLTRSASSPGTAGGTNHGNILSLLVDTALTVPNVALVGALHTDHDTGTMTGACFGIEGFIRAGGNAASADLRAIMATVTMHEGADATDVAGIRTGGVNANVGWTGTVTNAYGVRVDANGVGTNRWAIYTDGGDPSRFGGAVTVDSGGDDSLVLDHSVGTAALVGVFEDGIRHWRWGGNGSAADDWALFRYDDAGAFIDTPIGVDRSGGQVIFGNAIDVGGAATFASTLAVTGAATFDGTVSVLGSIFTEGILEVDETLFAEHVRVNVTGAGGDYGVIVNRDADSPAQVAAYAAGTIRWNWGANNNAGVDDWALGRFNDAGVFQGTTMIADRGTGDVTFEGSVTENSSESFKTHVRPFEGDAVAMIRPVAIRRYVRRADASGSERIGIVAEEANEVAPWLTGTKGTGFALGAGLAVTMAAVQQIDARLSKLEGA